ncbi:MAG: hypothetical protein KJ058_18665 [Thermoanaerobaculia bacterium]|nr:hypothetical protein [Thermoanaerobaculia bacterium]
MRAQTVALAGPGIGWHLGVEGPHGGQPVLVAGSPLARARGALVLAHGRGASALDILDLGAALAPPGWALVAPQAAGGSWYPQRFLAPLAANEPGLSSALAVLAEILAVLGEGGLLPERVALVGFSQGACLALERAAREPRRYAALLAFSGALIGPPASRARPRPAPSPAPRRSSPASSATPTCPATTCAPPPSTSPPSAPASTCASRPAARTPSAPPTSPRRGDCSRTPSHSARPRRPAALSATPARRRPSREVESPKFGEGQRPPAPAGWGPAARPSRTSAKRTRQGPSSRPPFGTTRRRAAGADMSGGRGRRRQTSMSECHGRPASTEAGCGRALRTSSRWSNASRPRRRGSR